MGMERRVSVIWSELFLTTRRNAYRANKDLCNHQWKMKKENDKIIAGK